VVRLKINTESGGKGMGLPGIPRQLRDLVREIPAAFKQSAAKIRLSAFLPQNLARERAFLQK